MPSTPPFLTSLLADQNLMIALGIMLIGLIVSMIPMIPGPPIVGLGAAYYAYRTGFAAYGWPTLVLLQVLALFGSTADWWLGYLGARKTGASPWASVAATLGGFIGMLSFSLPGLVIGALAGIAAVEYSQHKDWNKVLKAGLGYFAGYIVSMLVEVCTAVVMIGIFVAALYF